MARRIVPVTTETFAHLPAPCASCAFWEVGPASRFASDEPAPAAVAKRSWVSATSMAWGQCGLIAYVDDVPAGFVLYAPPAYVPRAAAFPTAPVSSDAVLLMTLRVQPDHEGSGLGRVLLQSMAKDLVKRGVKAIEAYGAVDEGCVLPATFLESLGFVTVRDHARHPRLRLDLRTTLTWREDVEGAWGRLVGVVRPFPAGARQLSRSGTKTGLTSDQVR